MPERALLAEAPATATAPVVLVVQDELPERVLTAQHLRESGFEVIEAANGDEARRVLGAVPVVDIVFVDLEMPGAMDGSSLLRLLRDRHPAAKAILTASAETDMAAVKGRGMFLSKPYRMVDLDHCLQRFLADPSIGRLEGGPRPSRPQLGAAPPIRRPARGNDVGPGGDISEEWASDLSRQLSERAARQQAVEPGAAKAARRAALTAYERARSRRLRLAVGFAIGAIAGSAIAILGPMAGLPDPLSAMGTQSASSVEMPTGKPASIEPETKSSPSVTASLPSTPAAAPETNQAPATSIQPAPAPPEPAAASPPSRPESTAPAQPPSTAGIEPGKAGQAAAVEPAATPLGRDEVREVQTRLRSFGFSPGPIDGAAGTMTTRAVMRYQQARGQGQTGTVDRELLTQLREDPAPAEQTATPEPRPNRVARPRRSDPFDSMRTAAQRAGHWLDSLLR
jgi:CheY-like chemotaxis protein